MRRTMLVVLAAAMAAGLTAAVVTPDPADSAQGPQLVQERNVDSNGDIRVHEQGTALVRDAGPAQPVRASGSIVLSPGSGTDNVQLYVVPTGKRLVIEYVDALVRAGGPATPAVELQAGDAHPLVLVQHGPDYAGGPLFVGGQLVRLYVDAGTVIQAALSRGPLSVGATADVSFVGHLVDLGEEQP
jgi:hypothetical protein